MTVLLAVILIPVSPVKAGNESITVNENSSIVITNMSGREVSITADMFDLSKTDWICMHNSSDLLGFIYVDENFTSVPLRNRGDKFVCSPIDGEAAFDSSSLGVNVEVVLDRSKPSVGYHDLMYFDQYTITNKEEVDISLYGIGDYTLKYKYMLPNGLGYEATTEDGWPGVLKPGETLILTVADNEVFNITNPYVACFWYTVGNFNNIEVRKVVAEEYAEFTTATYELDGCTYTVTNGSEYLDVEFAFNATTEIQAEIFTSKGVSMGTVNNVQSVGSEISTSIPKGGRIVFSGIEAPDEILSVKYYSLFEPVIDISGVRKAKPTENKNIYIHFPNGPLVPAGVSKDSKGYYISTEITYADTTLEQEKDTVGGFQILPIKDTTGMAVVNKWYVYNSETGKYFDASGVTGNTLTVEPLTTGVYSQLLETYGNSNEYHLYVEWDVPLITQSGIYNFVKDVKYTLESGKWTVEGDACVYSGNMNFYVDDVAGNYQLTLQ